MRRRILTVCLATVLALVSTPVESIPVYAAEYEASAEDNDLLYSTSESREYLNEQERFQAGSVTEGYTILENRVDLEGGFDMPEETVDYVYDSDTLNLYGEPYTQLTLAESDYDVESAPVIPTSDQLIIEERESGYTVTGLTTAGKNADVIIIPEGIVNIGASAFSKATFSQVDFSQNTTLEYLGNQSFEFCMNLKSITIPKSVKTCKTNASTGPFYHCGLETVIFEDGTTAIPSGILFRANKVTKIVLPETVTTIGSAAFRETAIQEIELPDGLTTIGTSAFYGTNLTNFTIPRLVTNLPDQCFTACNLLKEITIPNNIVSCSTNASTGPFYHSGVETVIFEDGTTTIPSGILFRANKVNNIVIPDTVTVIGASAFKECTALTEIVLPKNLDKVNEGVFNGCTKLGLITFADGLKKLPYRLTVSIQNSMIVTTQEGVKDIATDEGPFKTVIVIPDSVEVLDEISISNYRITSVTLPENVKTIGTKAFESSSGIKELIIPDSVETIESNAFYGCSGLTEMEIPTNVTKIGTSGVFAGCYNLKTVRFEDGTVDIPDYILYNATAVDEIVVPETVRTIGRYAFGGTAITAVELNDNITALGDSAFAGCKKLVDFELPEKLESIGDGTFSGCIGLIDFVLPDGLKTIGSKAFQGCKGLKVTIPESVESIGSNMFYNADTYVAIKGYFDSEAYRYAITNKITFIALNITTEGDVSVSLSLNGNVGILFNISGMPDELLSDDEAQLEITCGDDTEIIPATEMSRDEKGVCTVCYNVPVKNIDEVVYLRMRSADGRLVAINYDTKYNESAFIVSYSIQQYIDAINNNKASTAEAKALVEALKNYCHYSRKYFKLTDSYTATSAIKSKMNSVNSDTVVDYKKNIEGEVSGVQYVGSTLLLQAGTVLRHYFVINDSVSEYISIAVEENGSAPKSIKFTNASENIYYVDITNIGPNDFDTTYKLTISNAKIDDENMIIEASVLSYAYSVLDSSIDASLENLIKAMWVYMDAAKKYFVA